MKSRKRFHFMLIVGVLWATFGVATAGVTVVEGVIGPGALYGFYVPDGTGDHLPWNGDIIYFAHGWVEPVFPVVLPHSTAAAYRDRLNELGYAVAYSSYSVNGWAVEEAVRQTHQLRGLFKSHFGKPKHSYIIGESMGSNIAVALAETLGQQYDGALAMCGAVGGGQMTLDYMFDTRTVFDYYYPVVPGDAVNVPEDLSFPQVFGAMNAAIAADPTRLFELAGIDQLDFAYANFDELITTLIWRLYIHTFEANAIKDRTHGHAPFDNMGVVYTGSSDDEALNAGVDRFASTMDAKNYLEHHYEPTGRLRIPFLTLRNTRDQLIPMEHHDAFEAIVDAAGSGDLLVRQYIDRFGHCNFTVDEMLGAFEDLVAWVEDGVTPIEGEFIP